MYLPFKIRVKQHISDFASSAECRFSGSLVADVSQCVDSRQAASESPMAALIHADLGFTLGISDLGNFGWSLVICPLKDSQAILSIYSNLG